METLQSCRRPVEKAGGWSEKSRGGEGTPMSALVAGNGDGRREIEQIG